MAVRGQTISHLAAIFRQRLTRLMAFMFSTLDPANGVSDKPVLYGVSFEHFDSASGVSRSDQF